MFPKARQLIEEEPQENYKNISTWPSEANFADSNKAKQIDPNSSLEGSSAEQVDSFEQLVANDLAFIRYISLFLIHPYMMGNLTKQEAEKLFPSERILTVTESDHSHFLTVNFLLELTSLQIFDKLELNAPRTLILMLSITNEYIKDDSLIKLVLSSGFNVNSVIVTRSANSGSHNVDDDEKDNSTEQLTLLCMACERGYFTAARLLLENGANPNLGTGAIHTCLTETEDEVIDFANLCNKYGADANVRNSRGETFLLAAARLNGSFNLLTYLVSILRVDPNIADRDGVTPLMYICYSWRLQEAAFLVQNGADVTRKDAGGNTALHYLAHYLTPDLTIDSNEIQSFLQLMMSKGVEVNAKNRKGETAIDLIAQNLGLNFNSEASAPSLDEQEVANGPELEERVKASRSRIVMLQVMRLLISNTPVTKDEEHKLRLLRIEHELTTEEHILNQSEASLSKMRIGMAPYSNAANNSIGFFGQPKSDDAVPVIPPDSSDNMSLMKSDFAAKKY